MPMTNPIHVLQARIDTNPRSRPGFRCAPASDLFDRLSKQSQELRTKRDRSGHGSEKMVELLPGLNVDLPESKSSPVEGGQKDHGCRCLVWVLVPVRDQSSSAVELVRDQPDESGARNMLAGVIWPSWTLMKMSVRVPLIRKNEKARFDSRVCVACSSSNLTSQGPATPSGAHHTRSTAYTN